jgi:uncharacterized coiled-coil protein SlyX
MKEIVENKLKEVEDRIKKTELEVIDERKTIQTINANLLQKVNIIFELKIEKATLNSLIQKSLEQKSSIQKPQFGGIS